MFTTGYISLLVVMTWMGFAKGIRAVYSVLVIPSYVPLERLPSASSLQQIVVGFLSMGAGPLIGLSHLFRFYKFISFSLNNIIIKNNVSFFLIEQVTKNNHI